MGLALGLLLAPASGNATRRRLANSAREASDSARNQAHALAEPLTDVARQRAHAFAERHIPLADDFDVVDGRDMLDDPRLRSS